MQHVASTGVSYAAHSGLRSRFYCATMLLLTSLGGSFRECGHMVSRGLKVVKGGEDYDFMHKRGMFVKIYELALLIRLAKHDPTAAEVLTWLIYRMDCHNRATMVMLAMAEDLK